MKQISITLVMLASCSCVLAQDIFLPPGIQKRLHATQCKSNITIDGNVDDPDWNSDSIATNFTQLEPFQNQASRFRTEVKAAYDDRNLYIAFACFDSAGRKGIRTPDLKRDFDYKQHDMVAICIDGFNDKRNSITFATNAYGSQKDYLSFDDILFDSDWNGLWSVRTSITEQGWFAEFQIPWKTLRYKKGEDSTSTFNINFLRVKRSSNEISVWSPYPRAYGFNRMEYTGALSNLKTPHSSSNIQVNPYTLFSKIVTKGSDVGTEMATSIKPGGEIKWAINSNAVLDLTSNTDFAQADADLQVNNVSRFSVFFPEKRQFFLENASLFSTGLQGQGANGIGGGMYIQPFFSRRIGLDDSGNPIPITAGARFVNRTIKRSFGGIYNRQAEQGESQAQNIFVGRYSENIGKANRIGALMTFKGAQAGNLKDGYSNVVGAIDGFFRFGQKQSLSAMLINSYSSNTNNSGQSAYAQYLYTTNSINAWWTQSYIGKDFNPELGFTSRKEVIATTPGFLLNIRKQWMPFKRAIRSLNPGVSTQFYHQSSTGKLQERIYTLYPLWLEFQRGGNFYMSVINYYELIEGNFSPLGVSIAEGRYNFTRYLLSTASDASKKISYTTQYEYGNYYDGILQSINAAFSASPIPNVFIRLGINHNAFKNVGESSSSKSVSLYTAESRLALNPRIQLIGLYQYNSQDNRNAFNVRFSWEYKPLSYIYLVYNNRIFETNTRQQEQSFITKISYLKQF